MVKELKESFDQEYTTEYDGRPLKDFLNYCYDKDMINIDCVYPIHYSDGFLGTVGQVYWYFADCIIQDLEYNFKNKWYHVLIK